MIHYRIGCVRSVYSCPQRRVGRHGEHFSHSYRGVRGRGDGGELVMESKSEERKGG
jgi:hypothetical protein